MIFNICDIVITLFGEKRVRIYMSATAYKKILGNACASVMPIR